MAELHVHVEGTVTPDLARRLAERNGVEVPAGTIASDGRFAWSDFVDFLRVYDAATSVIRSGRDYRDIVFEYLVRCAEEGAIYVELTASADHAALVGISDEDHLDGIAQGIDDARAQTGIEARIIMSCVRHFGPEKAVEVARRTVERPHPYVTGFGMGGDEAAYPAHLFSDAYAIAARAGLGLTVHAGEWAGPESVRSGLALGVSRIGHGVRAVEDPELVRELAERGIVLEVCPTSNVVLGIYPAMEAHPLPRLREAGVPVTLGSDDPPYWDASIGGEYAVAATAFGLDEAALREITRTAIGAAFVQEEVRQRLLELV
ncbi:MAG TPA: adenosine deaminase [Solirubrobacteraceae bacterium]|nr:adenosine deaminase [Solirubrobacteraceae bacterium]